MVFNIIVTIAFIIFLMMILYLVYYRRCKTKTHVVEKHEMECPFESDFLNADTSMMTKEENDELKRMYYKYCSTQRDTDHML